MEKKLRDQILESGMIPKTAVSQMEQWQTIPQGSSEKVGEFDPKKVKALKEDIELSRMPVARETVLDLKRIMSKQRQVELFNPPEAVPNAKAGVDRLGRYYIAIPREQASRSELTSIIRPLTALIDCHLPKPRHRRVISNVSVIYNGEVPTHWLIETDAPDEEHIIKAR